MINRKHRIHLHQPLNEFASSPRSIRVKQANQYREVQNISTPHANQDNDLLRRMYYRGSLPPLFFASEKFTR